MNAANAHSIERQSTDADEGFYRDLDSGRGRKTTERWYGFVVAVTETAILLRKTATGKAACKEGAKFRQKQGVKS